MNTQHMKITHPAAARHWRPVALAGLIFLSGCATTHRTDSGADVRVPDTWQQTSADARTLPVSLSPWWTELQDPALTQLIQLALARNNNLAQAAIKVRRAQLVAGQAAADQLPNLGVRANTNASQALDGGATSRSHSLNASASWEVDLWNRLGTLRDAAEWEALATEQDRQAVAMSLVGTVANQYWQVAYLNQRVAASEQSMAYARQTLKLIQNQHSVGSVSGLEVSQATQALASQEAAHTQWVQQRVQARNALAILLDSPPGHPLHEAGRLPEGALPTVSAGLPASLLNRRPDLRAAELRLRKSLASVDATRASYYPALTLTAGVGTSSTALADVLRNPIGTLGAGLVLPFVQWREMQRSVAISEADHDIAIRAYRQSWYTALADVENALSARTQYEEQGTHLSEALKAAQTTERLAEARYRAGSAALKTWLDAQETRRQAENNLAQNRLNRLNAMATLYQVLGGGLQAQTNPTREAPGQSLGT
ncbi:efflux transporter outer membrane subunit [Aquabacterium sp.]|uniref:efflux transporter outer membrane subunit n=1 Tax=Aquabacterium sp. TaxID=1872578 RepID=UPI0025C4993E|nr:efflux transporter outer membrane subunit [Aquabacterium sp.]